MIIHTYVIDVDEVKIQVVKCAGKLMLPLWRIREENDIIMLLTIMVIVMRMMDGFCVLYF